MPSMRAESGSRGAGEGRGGFPHQSATKTPRSLRSSGSHSAAPKTSAMSSTGASNSKGVIQRRRALAELAGAQTTQRPPGRVSDAEAGVTHRLAPNLEQSCTLVTRSGRDQSRDDAHDSPFEGFPREEAAARPGLLTHGRA